VFFITDGDRPEAWVSMSSANDWQRWLLRNIPHSLNDQIRARLVSNLKHILVGLELKKALVLPHAQRENDYSGVLFEPYFQSLIFEFCVGAYSVVESLGASHWLDSNGEDGTERNRIRRELWRPALLTVYDRDGEYQLERNVLRIENVRDKMHQDGVGARNEIDWHTMGFDTAFVPANQAIETLLRRAQEALPRATNLSLPRE